MKHEIENFIKIISNYIKDIKEIRYIFDVGSRDCLESVYMSKIFNDAKIFAFECNPDTIPVCLKNIENEKNITLIPKAVNSYDGICKFYPVDLEKTNNDWPDKNPGASSLSHFVKDSIHVGYVQKEIELECTTLKTVINHFKIPSVDLIWIDLQGAELIALKSLDAYLIETKFIYVEVSHTYIFEDQCSFDEIDNFLNDMGFIRLTNPNKNHAFENIIYVNKKLT
jgi:FkbM family methyltransferase